jgi:hypothetical protein
MAKGHQCLSKARKLAKESAKTKVTDKVADSETDKSLEKSTSSVRCLKCDNPIMDDTRALNCDRCGKVWKCSACIGIRTGTYDDLVTDAGKELCWFCEHCHDSVMNPEKDEKVVQLIVKLTEQLCRLEKKLDAKVDVGRMEALEGLVNNLDVKLDKGYDGMMNTLEKSRLDVTAVQGCVQGALKIQSKEDKDEEEDKKKRIASVIIHGMNEPAANESDDRKNEDCDLVQVLLHKLDCDDISVKDVTRLGPRPILEDARARPMRLMFETEDSKIRVLKRAKNLKEIKEGAWNKVFIHQDLTPKERELRKVLIQELKERKEKGEKDLMIVNGKISVRRKFNY